MIFDSARVQKLRDFGLSEYAARAYLALLELGTSEARVVSRLSKVPTAKIYSTLDQLQERGLAHVEPGPPKRFTPAPFSAFLARRRERLSDELRELHESERALVELFPVRGTANADDRGAFLQIRGRESVVDKFGALARAATSDVLLLAADRFTQRGHVEPILAEAVERGVRVRALVRVADDSIRALSRIAQHAELRAKACPPGCPHDVAIAIFDSRQLMMIHFVPDDASRYHGKDVAFVAGEEAMVRAMRSVLEPLWDAAEPFAQAAARLASGLPRATTTLFADHARLVASWQEGLAAAAISHDLVSSLPTSRLGARFVDALAEAAARGVRQRIVAPVDDVAAAERIRQAVGPAGELRAADGGPLQRVSILDGRVAFFGPSGRDPIHRGAEDVTVRTDEAGAVRALADYFDGVWAASKPV